MDPSNSEQPNGTQGLGDNSSPLEHRVVATRSPLALQLRQMLAVLSRACRIALMEAEGAASAG
jgi:hypothetical protein